MLEVVIVTAIAALVLVPVVAAFTSTGRSTDHTARRALAMVMTNACMERFKARPLAELAMLFGPGSSTGSTLLAADPVLRGELAGAPFEQSTREFRLEGELEMKKPDQVAVLSFRCRFPSRGSGGPEAVVSLSRVVVDYAKIGWGDR